MSNKLAIEKKLCELHSKQNVAWKEYDRAAKLIEKQKDELLDTIEDWLRQSIAEKCLFTIRWTIVLLK